MRTISRRDFMKVAMGFVAFVPAFRTLAQTGPSPDQASNAGEPLVVEKFEEGRVQKITADGFVVQNAVRGAIALHLSPATVYWEALFVKDIPIEIGDFVYAWGNRRADGSLDTENIWANLVNLQGTLSSVEKVPGGLRVAHQDPSQGAHIISLEARTRISELGAAKKPMGDQPVALRQGQFVQVIGRVMKDNSVLATDVYAD